MQNITVAGRLGQDSKLATTQAGKDVLNFTVAVDQGYGDRKQTNWWRVSLWGERGRKLAQYLRKGSQVTVTGNFELGEYEGKPQLNIMANEIALQGGKQDGSQGHSDGFQDKPAAGGFGDDLDDSVPFLDGGAAQEWRVR